MKIAVYLFILVSVLISFRTVYTILTSFHLTDFAVYYQGTQDLIRGINPYHDPRIDFNYPPSAALFFYPFTLLPFALSQKIWTVLSFSAFIGSICVLLKSPGKPVSLLHGFLIFSFAIHSFPVKFTLGMGQINVVILFLISLTFFFYRMKNQFWSGVFLGIAALIKLSPILLLLFFIKKGQGKIVGVSVVTISVGLLLSVILFGQNVGTEYFFQRLPTIPSATNAAYYNQALTGFLARANIAPNIGTLVNFLALGILLLFSFLATKEKKRGGVLEMGEYGLFILAILIGSGFSWQHHFVLTLIPFTAFFMMSNTAWQMKKLTVLFGVISYFLIVYNVKSPESTQGLAKLFLSHVFWGALLFFFLLLKIITGKASFYSEDNRKD